MVSYLKRTKPSITQPWKPELPHRWFLSTPSIPVSRELIKLLLKFGHAKITVQVWGFVRFFVTCKFIDSGVVNTSSNTQAGRPHPVGCLHLLTQYIRIYPHIWEPLLHPQPKGTPCRGDGDPLSPPLNEHFHIIFTSTLGYSKIPLFFKAPHQNSLCISILTMPITRLARLVLLDFITLINCESGIDSEKWIPGIFPGE
jgi:hypothetical protein